jgi:ribonuclease HII
MNPRYENQKYKLGYKFVIGCDEVGRGCLAGPVVAAAVALPQIRSTRSEIRNWKRIKDSKLLSADKREELSAIIKQHALWGIGMVDEKVIDKINIHHASLLAMRRAVNNLLCHCERVHPSEAICLRDKVASSPDKDLTPRNDKVFLFVDGKFPVPDVGMEQEAVVDGDNKILSVAAASIIAKVFRDELMRKLHSQYPVYNFAQHKGYATLEHRQMVIKHGLSDIHRASFCSHLVN